MPLLPQIQIFPSTSAQIPNTVLLLSPSLTVNVAAFFSSLPLRLYWYKPLPLVATQTSFGIKKYQINLQYLFVIGVQYS
jgi:hypothetical protein